MWGNHKRRVTYYSCQPTHQRAKNIPADHPAHVYLNEARLSDALLPFLGSALFGSGRTDNWRRCLEAAAAPEQQAPAADCIQELEADIADLERRLSRQLLNLEADDITPALRRRVGQRVDELEAAIADRRQRVIAPAEQSATEAPTFAHVAPLLDRLPLLADRLLDVPQAELRALLEKLQLDVVFQSAESTVDVALTLFDGGEPSEDWSAPPAV